METIRQDVQDSVIVAAWINGDCRVATMPREQMLRLDMKDWGCASKPVHTTASSKWSAL